MILALALGLGGLGGTGQAGVKVIVGSTARQCADAVRYSRPPGSSMVLCDDAVVAMNEGFENITASFANRAVLRMRAGDRTGAMDDFATALARQPRSGETWLAQGMALMQAGAAGPEVLPMFEKAIAYGTRSPALAYYGRAAAHEQSGDLAAALADYRHASELDPAWALPKEDLARFSRR